MGSKIFGKDDVSSGLAHYESFFRERSRKSFCRGICADPRRLPHGFTLVEMLVVIAIIGVLSALLMPSLMNARKTALSMTCANNLKQCGMLMVVYTNDNNGSFPEEQTPNSIGTYTWGAFLALHVGEGKKGWDSPKNKSAFLCPSSELAGYIYFSSTPGGTTADSSMYRNYGVNLHVAGNPPQGQTLNGTIFRNARYQRVSRPSTMFIFADGQGQTQWYIGNPQSRQYFYVAHNDSFNMVFIDLHVGNRGDGIPFPEGTYCGGYSSSPWSESYPYPNKSIERPFGSLNNVYNVE